MHDDAGVEARSLACGVGLLATLEHGETLTVS